MPPIGRRPESQLLSAAVTEGTVKNYISAILAKTGLHDRTQAALFAVRHHLAGDEPG